MDVSESKLNGWVLVGWCHPHKERKVKAFRNLPKSTVSHHCRCPKTVFHNFCKTCKTLQCCVTVVWSCVKISALSWFIGASLLDQLRGMCPLRAFDRMPTRPNAVQCTAPSLGPPSSPFDLPHLKFLPLLPFCNNRPFDLPHDRGFNFPSCLLQLDLDVFQKTSPLDAITSHLSTVLEMPKSVKS